MLSQESLWPQAGSDRGAENVDRTGARLAGVMNEREWWGRWSEPRSDSATKKKRWRWGESGSWGVEAQAEKRSHLCQHDGATEEVTLVEFVWIPWFNHHRQMRLWSKKWLCHGRQYFSKYNCILWKPLLLMNRMWVLGSIYAESSVLLFCAFKQSCLVACCSRSNPQCEMTPTALDDVAWSPLLFLVYPCLWINSTLTSKCKMELNKLDALCELMSFTGAGRWTWLFSKLFELWTEPD